MFFQWLLDFSITCALEAKPNSPTAFCIHSSQKEVRKKKQITEELQFQAVGENAEKVGVFFLFYLIFYSLILHPLLGRSWQSVSASCLNWSLCLLRSTVSNKQILTSLLSKAAQSPPGLLMFLLTMENRAGAEGFDTA